MLWFHLLDNIYCTVAVDCGVPLPLNHRICWICAAKRKCAWCHRYLREVRFDDESDVCKACTTRKHHWQMGGGNIRNTFLRQFLDGDAVPIEQLIDDKRDEIKTILIAQLEERRYVCKVIFLLYRLKLQKLNHLTNLY